MRILGDRLFPWIASSGVGTSLNMRLFCSRALSAQQANIYNFDEMVRTIIRSMKIEDPLEAKSIPCKDLHIRS